MNNVMCVYSFIAIAIEENGKWWLMLFYYVSSLPLNNMKTDTNDLKATHISKFQI